MIYSAVTLTFKGFLFNFFSLNTYIFWTYRTQPFNWIGSAKGKFDILLVLGGRKKKCLSFGKKNHTLKKYNAEDMHFLDYIDYAA